MPPKKVAMKIKEYRLYGAVSAAGAGTFVSETSVFGLLYAVQWIEGFENFTIISEMAGKYANNI